MHLHETTIDGKRWLDEVSACVCSKKVGDRYIVTCTIHQRGTHPYACTKKADRIARGEKIWYLTDEARKPVRNAIRSFERRTAALENGRHVSVSIPQGRMEILLRRRSADRFDAVVKESYRQSFPKTYWLRNLPLGEIVRDTAHDLCYGRENPDLYQLADSLRRASEETLPENPFYRAALASGDELLQLQLRLFYQLADKDDCRKLRKLLRCRLLPPLEKEYDCDFVIPSGEVDRELLRRSGYGILHRPYFAMRGYTHDLWTINPHKKSGTDAAPKDAKPTSFQAFLRLFETEKDGKS